MNDAERNAMIEAMPQKISEGEAWVFEQGFEAGLEYTNARTMRLVEAVQERRRAETTGTSRDRDASQTKIYALAAEIKAEQGGGE